LGSWFREYNNPVILEYEMSLGSNSTTAEKYEGTLNESIMQSLGKCCLPFWTPVAQQTYRPYGWKVGWLQNHRNLA
jgi:hypothetical protein